MNTHQHIHKNGFTLIEIVIVVVILGILAMIVIPKFQGQNNMAKESATKSMLGSVRTSIASFRAASAMSSGTPRYPTLTELTTMGVVLSEPIAPNPYKNTSKSASVISGTWTATSPPVTTTDEGWRYDSTTGKFWANSNTTGVNENTF